MLALLKSVPRYDTYGHNSHTVEPKFAFYRKNVPWYESFAAYSHIVEGFGDVIDSGVLGELAAAGKKGLRGFREC